MVAGFWGGKGVTSSATCLHQSVEIVMARIPPFSANLARPMTIKGGCRLPSSWIVVGGGHGIEPRGDFGTFHGFRHAKGFRKIDLIDVSSSYLAVHA